VISLFAEPATISAAGMGTGAAKALKAMDRERRAMMVLLNIMTESSSSRAI